MSIIGNYLVGSVVGRGKYGWVSRAKHLKLNLKVAVKHAPWAIGEQCSGGSMHKDCEHAMESSCRAALHNEAAVLSMLSHPAIVSMLEVVNGPLNTIYIFLEDLGNTSLSSFVKLQGSPGLKEQIVCNLTKSLAEGLNHLHAVGILHRDIKPENVMIVKCQNGFTAKLIDLGLATTWAPNKLLNTSDVRVGTVAYMAPELMLENTEYGAKIDVFSFGATLYFSLTGVAPFHEFIRNGIKLTTSIFGLQINHDDAIDAMSLNAAHLVRAMIHINPNDRCTIAYIIAHSWITSIH